MFVLNERGREFTVVFADGETVARLAFRRKARDFLFGRLLPCFDVDARVLRWGAHVLKEFRQPAKNQITILEAAEELGWPNSFDDPLPRIAGIDAKVRCHDAIKRLNHHQRPYLIHFAGDGTGCRICWAYR
jgi:hypothetical protein